MLVELNRTKRGEIGVDMRNESEGKSARERLIKGRKDLLMSQD